MEVFQASTFLPPSKKPRVIGIPLRQEFLDLTAVLCRADDIHIQFAMAHFVVEIDWFYMVPITITWVWAQLQMPQVEHDLLTLIQ